ncbi:hypothetical protein HMPREF9140_01224 [Prevotella micans F0438]|uniref:Uncharacterized protein n=1 Tax=Prevotella micans F0438 TaxID=883158 RepID=H1Q2T6_9BACT|nr:hypothetical protein [Prevotella micans]EHO69534.1 hypothetical protein HMPREF9140_01224 [Prevotella micans F0438]
MKKQTYISPRIEVIHINDIDAVMQTISLPISPGGGPGGGGDAKGGFFDEEDEENEQGMAGYSPWED